MICDTVLWDTQGAESVLHRQLLHHYNEAPQARTSRVTFASSVGLYTSVQFLGLKVKWCYLVLDRGALFFIMAACYFCNMVIWLNTIKYSSNWSPLLPGWVSRWLNVDVSILEYIQMSNVWLLLLLKMMLCLIVVRSFEALLGISFLGGLTV